MICYNDNAMADMIYTDRMQAEDEIIAHWAIHNNFKPLLHLYDDLMQICRFALWNYRKKYYDTTKSKYQTLAPDVCKQAIFHITRSKQWQFENNIVSLEQYSEDHEIDLLDIISSTPEKPNNENKDITDTMTRVTHFEIVNTLSTDRKKQIIDLGLQGYKLNEIANKIGCNRSYVIKVKKEYADKAKEIVQEQKKE
jgi:RNA polymerase sigma factor (sigma-70 family)